MTENTNPGNFANRPKEEVQNIAKKGGEASHSGGFTSMDADKQVCVSQHVISCKD
jgi:general stress protein YciG